MPLRAATLVATLAMFTLGIASAQSKEHRPLLARLSYRTSYAVDGRDRKQFYPQICFALYVSGEYRLSRVTNDGSESFQGSLSEGELSRVRKMLETLGPESSEGGIIRRGSESVIAEVVSDTETMRYVWVDPDHERAFPGSVMTIVNWLQNFKTEGASPITIRELSEQPICPPASGKPVQPVVAGLEHSRADRLCDERP